MTDRPTLTVKDLAVRYRTGFEALRGVTLAVRSGVFGLLGPNGAGKSSLMRVLATLQRPSGGTATFGDIDVLHRPEEVRQVLGYLPQDFGLYPEMTAERLLDQFAVLRGLRDRSERRRRVAEVLERVNLEGARRQRLGSFSGGMRQRFGIAQAIIGRPRLLIVDEPTAGLDPVERRRFHNLLVELGHGAVVLLSTHIVEDVAGVCGRSAFLLAGRVVGEGTLADHLGPLRGQVWEGMVPPGDAGPAWSRPQVVSQRLTPEGRVLRVVGPAPPTPAFRAVDPTLEDAYFSLVEGVGREP